MKLLITGINGFVGTNLYDKLYPSIDISGVDIYSDNCKKCKIFTWDEFPELPSVETIIHLAGVAHDTKNSTDESKYTLINVGLTKKIFEYFIESSATKFIYFSSVKAIADTVQGGSLSEDYPADPKTYYGKSKLEAERYLMNKKIPPGKYLYILRPAMIHGPGNKGNLNLLYSFAKSGFPYPLGAYDNYRSFTSIENVSHIIRRIVTENISPGIYNLCDDEPISTKEVVRLMFQSLEKRGIILNIPKRVVSAMALIGDFLHLPINSERLKKMTESYIVSNKKIRMALSVDKLPVSSKEGLMSTLNKL